MQAKGTLIPIGGNEDKGLGNSEIYTLEFIQESILYQVVKESGGKNANIVVIPTASSIPVEVADNYIQAFDKLGCDNVHILDIRKRSQSIDKKNLRLIEEADCVMFSGGDQSRIVRFIGGSEMHTILKDRYINENFVIAGTSAGAMAMSDNMIAGGSSTESLFKGAVQVRQGMSFMPELIIDTHFIRRGRFGRLAETLAMFPNLMGVGLAEDTGVVIKEGNQCRVIGSGMVLLFDPTQLTHNSHKVLPKGTPISMSNLKVHILANQDTFTLANTNLEISVFKKSENEPLKLG